MEHLNDLDFADDIVLLAQRNADMQSKLDDIARHSTAAGLNVNAAKTKAMQVNVNNTPSFTIEGNAIENVDDFQYLGSQITPNGGAISDINASIKKAKGAFGILRKVWRSNHIGLNTKLRIFNTNVKSVLLYASDT